MAKINDWTIQTPSSLETFISENGKGCIVRENSNVILELEFSESGFKIVTCSVVLIVNDQTKQLILR